MILRQLFDQVSSTYTYLLADERTREAVLVDPVFEQHGRDVALLREIGLKLLCVVDTHCHADHVTGAWLMKEALGSKIALSRQYGAGNVDLALDHGDPSSSEITRSKCAPLTRPAACRAHRERAADSARRAAGARV